jgi:murein L,D-transpeptidase YcbB/YkuD
MGNFFRLASCALLALTLSANAFAESDEKPSADGTIAAPDNTGGVSASAAPTTPAASATAVPVKPQRAKPELAPEDAAVADKLRELVENKLDRLVRRRTDREGIAAFYRDRDFAPLWIAKGTLLPRAKQAIEFLHGVAADGLEPDDYPTPSFANTSPEALAANEIELSKSVVIFVRHAQTGRVNFTRVSNSIQFDLEYPDPAAVLSRIASSTDPRATLDSFHPQHAGYKALKAMLAAERDRAAPKPDAIRIPAGSVLYPGTDDARVPLLRKRLRLKARDGLRYDGEVVAAVERFQQASNLNPDGVVGAITLARLNSDATPRASNVDTIVANMERWRWLPRDLGEAFVVVNVPDYTLKVVNRGATVWSTKIVVGKPGRYATPLFSETMKFITVNPTWNVPPSIIRNEYLPALQRDPYALARIGLRIGRNADGSLRVYQPPGERNALGRLRFNFPNRFLVYQHDTPDKHLFAKAERAYSHGCMRVENPEQYAETLLGITQSEQRYTVELIRSLYGRGERTIRFDKPIPVYVTYQTAFVDDAGQLQLRADIYGHDSEMANVLRSDRQVADLPATHRHSSGGQNGAAAQAGRRGRNDFQSALASDWGSSWRRRDAPSYLGSPRRRGGFWIW